MKNESMTRRSHQPLWLIFAIVALFSGGAALADDGHSSEQTRAVEQRSELDAAALAALGISEAGPVVQAIPRPMAPNSGAWAWTNGPYAYDGSGNIAGIGTQTFFYDTQGRLVQASISRLDQPAFQTQAYGYDVFGNMVQRTRNGVLVTLPTDQATNHLATPGATFDEAGNLTEWQADGRSYVAKFDALNMAQSLTGQTSSSFSRHVYMYTADDERIWSWDTTASPDNISHWKVRGLDQKVLRDFENRGDNWTLSRDYIYREGQLLAAVTPTGTLHFSLDHLGTPRVITDDSRVRVGFHHYFPFGEEWTLSSDPQEKESMKFTGHERDADPAGSTESLDYMHARYYSSAWGRFLSVDPVLDIENALGSPQQWNRYSYANNNPISNIDPDGAQVAGFNIHVNADYRRYKTGEISRAQFQQHQRGRSIGALIAAATIFAAEAGPALLTWFLANPNGANQLADAVLSPPGSSTLPVSAVEATFRQALVSGPEKISGFSIFGTKGMVGDVFNRNILSLSADAKGGSSIAGLFKALESEAKAAGATQLRIIGHAIINPKLINPELAKRFGYEFRQINKDTIELVKTF